MSENTIHEKLADVVEQTAAGNPPSAGELDELAKEFVENCGPTVSGPDTGTPVVKMMTDEEYAEKATQKDLPSDNLNALDQVITNAEDNRPAFPPVVYYVTGPDDTDDGIPAGLIRPALVTRSTAPFACNLAVVLDVDDQPNVAGTGFLARRSVPFDPAQTPGTFHVDD